MSDYTVARIDEIDELSDGRCPFRPVRKHFGIMSFGVNTWTGKSAGDRIINEHDEADEHEELYLVQQGRATFELDGERVDAPAGTMVFARPGVKRTAFAEDAGTTIVAIGGTPGEVYDPSGFEIWLPLNPLYEAGEVRRGGGSRPRADRGESRGTPACSTTSRAARAWPGGRPMRSSTCAARSSDPSGSARSPPGTRTSIRSARSRRSRS